MTAATIIAASGGASPVVLSHAHLWRDGNELHGIRCMLAAASDLQRLLQNLTAAGEDGTARDVDLRLDLRASLEERLSVAERLLERRHRSSGALALPAPMGTRSRGGRRGSGLGGSGPRAAGRLYARTPPTPSGGLPSLEARR